MKMKKILSITLAAVLAAAVMTGCGCKKKPAGGDMDKSSSQNAGQVDINKLDADKLYAAEDDYRAEIGDVEVTIGDAKTIEYNGEDIVIVEFVYKNNGSEPMPFTGALDVVGTQDERTLTSWVVDNYEGVDMLSLTEPVESGQHINVQKAFRLKDKENPVEIVVYGVDNGVRTTDYLMKTFTFTEE